VSAGVDISVLIRNNGAACEKKEKKSVDANFQEVPDLILKTRCHSERHVKPA
jgi:hypothetical protein